MTDRRRWAAGVVGALLLCLIGASLTIWALQMPARSNTPSLTAAAAHRTTLPGRWKRTFDDEFKGHRLNRSKWQPGWFGTGVTRGVTSNDRECYSSKQVTVSHGNLRLRAVAKQTRCGGAVRAYRSGIVSTDPAALGGYRKGYQFKYGVVEFRAKVPGYGRGRCANWTALWTNGQQWPTDGEMDVLECLNGKPSWYLHSDVPGGAYSVPGGPPQGNWIGWHTFAIDWEPTFATVYFDGKRVGSHVYKVPHPNYLVIANALRKGSPAIVPDVVKVDWVRVWRHSTARGAGRLTLSGG